VGGEAGSKSCSLLNVNALVKCCIVLCLHVFLCIGWGVYGAAALRSALQLLLRLWRYACLGKAYIVCYRYFKVLLWLGFFMSFIVEGFEKAVESGCTVVEEAKRLLMGVVVPEKISRLLLRSF